MTSPVIETFRLGDQWQTLDPFLFCAHHLDAYPASNGELGPKPSLVGRMIGSDFDNRDGWNMYHGSTVPGFPQHPHRGFETVTYVRRGYCDHSDSLGARARFGQGDMQWITTGAGIVHSEMFPLLNPDQPNPLHLFQIWLNLPAANKMVDPYFSMYWEPDIPTYVDDQQTTEVTVLAGSLSGVSAPAPPPDSWASNQDHDVQIWHVKMEPNSLWVLPEGPETSNRVLYFFEGESLTVAGQALETNTAAILECTRPAELEAGARPMECLMLQGRPIGEPIARYGPFVMNTETEIRQAMVDYQKTQFGGWPWSSDDPTHGHSAERFAVHADGRVDGNLPNQG